MAGNPKGRLFHEGRGAGREDGIKAAGALASPVRCQGVEPGKSGSESCLEIDIKSSLEPAIIQQVYCDESRSHQKVMSDLGEADRGLNTDISVPAVM